MDMAKIGEIIKSTTEEEKEMLYQMLTEMQNDKKREEIQQADEQINDILIKLTEKYKIMDEDSNKISSINLTYFEDDNSVTFSISYQ